MQCPFCKETMQDGAIKCRHCGSMLNQQHQGSIQSSKDESNYNMIDWYKKVITNYVTFTGRARRKEFWYFTLANLIITFSIGFIGGLIGIGKGVQILANIYCLAVMLPGIAVGIRRLHDTNRSGWWCLLPIVNIVFWAQDTISEANQYGFSPK